MGVYQGVTTVELDVSAHPLFSRWLLTHFVLQNLAAETAAYMTTKHPDYAILAARIAVSNLHKETKKSFSAVIKDLYEYGAYHVTQQLSSSTDSVLPAVNPKNGRPASMISKDTYEVVQANAERLDSAVIYSRDFSYNL